MGWAFGRVWFVMWRNTPSAMGERPTDNCVSIVVVGARRQDGKVSYRCCPGRRRGLRQAFAPLILWRPSWLCGVEGNEIVWIIQAVLYKSCWRCVHRSACESLKFGPRSDDRVHLFPLHRSSYSLFLSSSKTEVPLSRVTMKSHSERHVTIHLRTKSCSKLHFVFFQQAGL
jgi:hypothetical protein